ncbi:MAG: hypothetical protein HOO96_06445 [Polyangiaceae bacterium]|nr:hypothetical protein [Polyangiaceae bacterium]
MSSSKACCVLVLALACPAVACGAGEGAGEGGEPALQSSTDGLTIAELQTGRVRGSFSRGGATLGFTLVAIADAHRATLVDEAGSPLLDVTLKDGVEDGLLLGGRAHVHGAIDGDQVLDGDGEAAKELEKNPATKLIPELKEALRAKGIDPAMFSASAAPPDSSHAQLGPKAWRDGSGFMHLGYGESWDFATLFFGATTFELRPEAGSTSAVFQVLTPWYNAPERFPWIERTFLVRRVYGAYRVRVSNNQLPLCWNGGCQNTTLMVKTW